MAVATLTSEPTGPLSQIDQEEVAAAHARSRKIRKAAGVAAFNGWMAGFFAVCSAPFALFSFTSFIVTAGLGVVAYNEFRGRKGLLQFNRNAPLLLGWNQIGFMTLIIIYCFWMLFTGLTSEGPFAAELQAKPELGVAFDNVEDFDRIYKLIIAAVYVTVIVLTGVFQGLNALYYFTRRNLVISYVEKTPDWVLQLGRLTAT